MMTRVDDRVCCTLCVEYVTLGNAIAVVIPDADELALEAVAICKPCATAVRDALAAVA